jgi:hypothetical protein
MNQSHFLPSFSNVYALAYIVCDSKFIKRSRYFWRGVANFSFA